MKKRDYMINAWHSGGTRGVSVLLRTPDRQKWVEGIRDAIGKYGIHKDWCRVVTREDLTIFSFPVSNRTRLEWQFANFTVKPLKMTYGFPAGVIEQ